MNFRLYSPSISRAELARVKPLFEGCGHYPYQVQNRNVFASGYLALMDRLKPGMKVLEIGCGSGEFSSAVARAFPQVEFVATDFGEWPINRCRELYPHLPNLRFEVADAHHLSQFAPESFDMVVSTATLHHLANNIPGASTACARVLKPGGSCMFIYEPLGHNVFVAGVRAVMCSLGELIDESNLYLSAIRRFGEPFRSTEVQAFNLLGYFAKMIPAKLYPAFLGATVDAIDHWSFRAVPWLCRQAGNCNLIFTK